jgi:hypothetical protein
MAGIPIVPPGSSGGGDVQGLSILAGTIVLAACGWLGSRFARDRQDRETSGDRVLRSAPLSVKTKERSAV